MVTFLLVLPALLLAGSVLLIPLWWSFAKKWLADHEWFYAEVREESALAIQRGQRVRKVYIATSEERRNHFEDLANKYGKDLCEVLQKGESFVFVGWPFFGLDTVRDNFWTEDLERATDKKTHHGTISLKVETLSFPALLSDLVSPNSPAGTLSPRGELAERVRKGKNDEGSKISPEEVRKSSMGLEHHETADGYKTPFGAEMDYQVDDPVALVLKLQYPGPLMTGLMNTASFKAAASLRVIELDADPSKPVTSVVQRSIEPRFQALLGLTPLTPDMTSDGLETPDENHRLVDVLKSFGIRVFRVRAVNLELPAELLELFRKPVAARASATADIVAADARITVATRDAEALRKKGEGERDYQVFVATGNKDAAKLEAEGDTSRILAWDPNTVPAAAVAAHLEQKRIDAWQEGVKSPGAGKVIITGSPGARAHDKNLEGLAATLATVVKEVSTETKENSLPAGDSKEEPPAKE